MTSIFDITSKVSTPLALAGVVVAVLFFIFRHIIKKNIFPTLTAALLDRVTHKAHVVNCTWESYRLKDTLKNR